MKIYVLQCLTNRTQSTCFWLVFN